jgi:isopentenyl phosphate kinase
MTEITFLKLGGSLITDKKQPNTPRMDVITRLAKEIHTVRVAEPGLKLILGHGSGSFGHTAAAKYGTRAGVQTAEEWRGFAEVWLAASALNRIVVEALHQTGLPAISFPTASATTAIDGKIKEWDLAPIENALAQGLIPLVFGDVAFDRQRGGTILSTEDIFTRLARHFKPQRILLAGIEAGVWADYPSCTQLVETITPDSLNALHVAIGGSSATDVTGGMAAKVRETLALLADLPGCEALIFSGSKEGTLEAVLAGASSGTVLLAE